MSCSTNAHIVERDKIRTATGAGVWGCAGVVKGKCYLFRIDNGDVRRHEVAPHKSSNSSTARRRPNWTSQALVLLSNQKTTSLVKLFRPRSGVEL
jgi:hypothetical protein